MRCDLLPCIFAVLTGLFGASCTTEMRAVPKLGSENLEICHGYGCTFRSKLQTRASDEGQFAAIMASGAESPAAERQAIGRSVSYFENRTRQVTGVTDQRKSKLGAAQREGPDGLHR